MKPLGTKWPAGLSSPQALQTAVDALSRRYVQPQTAQHPVVVDQARELALLLSAYGLVPTGPQPLASRSGRVGTRPRNSSAPRSVVTADFGLVGRHDVVRADGTALG